MLQRWLAPAPDNPPWLFGLRLAARLSNYLLLLFALVSLASLASPSPPVLGLLLLMVLFCAVNLRAITLSKYGRRAEVLRRLRVAAHLLSAALPLAYLLGLWYTGANGSPTLQQGIAVTAPPLLNWLAIDESLKRRGAGAGRVR